MSDSHRFTPILLAALLLTSCVTTSAPDDWTAAPVEMESTTYGSWVDVPYFNAAGTTDTTLGELIAVSPDSLYVLPLEEDLHAIARADVIAADLEIMAYDANWGYLATWTTLGSLSTASHGFLLAFSFPIWLIAGSAATSVQSRRPVYTNPSVEVLQRFARFPQGLPPELDRHRLRSKPLGE